MADKPPLGTPPATAPQSPDPASSVEREDDPGVPVAPAEEPDPFDALWDPDMDTRPERIRRGRGRARPEARYRGGGPSRGKPRDTA